MRQPSKDNFKGVRTCFHAVILNASNVFSSVYSISAESLRFPFPAISHSLSLTMYLCIYLLLYHEYSLYSRKRTLHIFA